MLETIRGIAGGLISGGSIAALLKAILSARIDTLTELIDQQQTEIAQLRTLLENLDRRNDDLVMQNGALQGRIIYLEEMVKRQQADYQRILDENKSLRERVNLLERTLKQNGIEIPTINTSSLNT